MSNNPQRLLLHVCCGPCAAYPLDALSKARAGQGTGQKYDVTGLFYNPNIHPGSEHTLRSNAAKAIFERYLVPIIIVSDCMQDRWETLVPEDSAIKEGYFNRCAMCYRLRLSYTALFAYERGYDMFSTTLLISPYQNHELIIEIGGQLAERYNVKFCYQDIRAHFRAGQRIAREQELYMQKYCGCILSRP